MYAKVRRTKYGRRGKGRERGEKYGRERGDGNGTRRGMKGQCDWGIEDCVIGAKI